VIEPPVPVDVKDMKPGDIYWSTYEEAYVYDDCEQDPTFQVVIVHGGFCDNVNVKPTFRAIRLRNTFHRDLYTVEAADHAGLPPVVAQHPGEFVQAGTARYMCFALKSEAIRQAIIWTDETIEVHNEAAQRRKTWAKLANNLEGKRPCFCHDKGWTGHQPCEHCNAISQRGRDNDAES
jgi:hypothetical protein